MLEHLPEDVRRNLLFGRPAGRRARHRHCVHVGDAVFPLLRLWDSGFAVSTARVPRLRGLVDLYDGPRHLSQCLILATDTDDEVTVYEFKRVTAVRDTAAHDYAEEVLPEVHGALPRPV